MADDREDMLAGSRLAGGYPATVRTVVQVQSAENINLAQPPGFVIPRQVPPPAAGFVDRSEVLAWLGGRLGGAGQVPGLAVLAGLPGMGKRAVVREWVRHSRDRFPGGDLHVDCADFGAGAGEGTADVSGMVASCLRAVGVEYMPATLQERVRLFRSQTALAPVLVVLENATEPAQVLSLVPNAPGSLVLVTTSADLRELRLDGAEFQEVGGLDDAAAAELVAVVCGPGRAAGEQQGIAELVRWCAGMPIALRILAARAAGQRGPAIAELAAEVADETRRLAGMTLGGKAVSAAFISAYGSLPAAARLLYRRLGLLPVTDFGAEVAAAAAGHGGQEARRLLEVLAAAYLVESRDGGRYALHQLARLHAREVAAAEEPPEQREAVLSAVVRYYLVRALFAEHAVMGARRARVADHGPLLAGKPDPFDGPDRRGAALAWLDAERANFVPVVQAAAVHGWDGEVVQLAWALMAYYYNRRHLADWVIVANAGIGAAARDGERAAEARLRLSVSRAFTDLGELSRAREEIDAAGQLASAVDDMALQASVSEFLGRYFDVADPGQALPAYDRAYDLNVRAGEQRGAGLALYYAGCALDAAGQHTKALARLTQARDLLRSVGDDRMASRALLSIGSAYAHLDQQAEAVASLEEAARELAGLHYEAQAREELARTAEQAGDHDEAVRQLQRAMEVYAQVHHPRAAEIADMIG